MLIILVRLRSFMVCFWNSLISLWAVSEFSWLTSWFPALSFLFDFYVFTLLANIGIGLMYLLRIWRSCLDFCVTHSFLFLYCSMLGLPQLSKTVGFMLPNDKILLYWQWRACCGKANALILRLFYEWNVHSDTFSSSWPSSELPMC